MIKYFCGDGDNFFNSEGHGNELFFVFSGDGVFFFHQSRSRVTPCPCIVPVIEYGFVVMSIKADLLSDGVPRS